MNTPAFSRDDFNGPAVSLVLQVMGGVPLLYSFAYALPGVLDSGGGAFPRLPTAVLFGLFVAPFAAIIYAGGYLGLVLRARRDPQSLSRRDRFLLGLPATFPGLTVAGILVRTWLR